MEIVDIRAPSNLKVFKLLCMKKMQKSGYGGRLRDIPEAVP